MKFQLFRRFSWRWPFFILLAAAVLALNIPALNYWLKNTVYFALQPIQKNIWQAGASMSGFFEPLAHLNSIAAENQDLRAQIAGFLSENSQISDLRNENQFLRQGLNLDLAKEFDLKMADIIAKNIARDSIIINKGSRDMIGVGMPVITSQKAIVGKVVKVYDNFSEAVLITENNFSFDVKIGENEIDGLVKGKGNGQAIIDLVPKDKELKTGDAAVTSVLGGIFPAGLVVGTINKVVKNDIDTFQSAQMSLFFDVNRDQRVFIVINKYLPDLGSAFNDKDKQK